MGHDTSRSWYENQKARDREASAKSEPLLGELADVFSRLMAYLDEALKTTSGEGLVEDIPTKAKLAVAYHCRGLLWSAWQEALAGRYGSATDHWRSITEAPRFLVALELNPALAGELFAGRLRIETVLRTIRDRAKDEDAKLGDELFAQMQDELKGVQPFSHVSVEATAAMLPIVGKGAERRILVGATPVVHEQTLKRVAVHLADSARSLILASTFAFQQQAPEVARAWESTGQELVQECAQLLTQHARELRLDD